MKRIKYEDVYGPIKSGMTTIASVVGRTLGPGGLTILIERQGQALNGDALEPLQTKDGVTVAEFCASENPEENIVIQAVKSICKKTNRAVGDGTTTAIVLGKAILDESFKIIEEDKLNPQIVREELEIAGRKVLDLIAKEAVPCNTIDMVEYVAKISANGDAEISSVIRKAFEAVGAEGVITVDDGGGKYHTLEVVNGYQFKRGAESQDRFFNNANRTKFEADNAHVLLYDGHLNSVPQVLAILEMIYKQHNGKMPPVVFMANDFSLDVLQVLLINKAEAGLPVCAVRNPHQTKVTTAILDDLSVFLGGSRIGNGNKNLASIEFDDLGIADKIVIDKYTATIFGGAGSEELVIQRIDQLKAQRTEAESPYDAALLSDRIASLSEGIAKIGVGGLTDLEVKEKYHRIEDAVNAARAAVEMGVVPGGGATLFRISNQLTGSDAGSRILREALKEPFRKILSNLGIGEVQTSELEFELRANPKLVFDGHIKKLVDAFEAGIIDPAKVTKTAFENAMSVASVLITCGGTIVDIRKDF